VARHDGLTVERTNARDASRVQGAIPSRSERPSRLLQHEGHSTTPGEVPPFTAPLGRFDRTRRSALGVASVTGRGRCPASASFLVWRPASSA